MTQPVYLTKEAIKSLESEKEDLEKNRMPKIADAINRAKELGDLKENFEYHEAKQQMGFAQGRVREIEQQLLHAVVYESGGGGDSVTLGSTIEVTKGDVTRQFHIVGAQEARPAEGYISNESPLGAAFLGAQVGDDVEVETPAGVSVYSIESIN